MSEHLSSRQIAEWIIGDRTASEEMHVTGCAKCQREIESFEGSLALFSNSVRDWSEQQRATGVGMSRVQRSARLAHPLRWVTAAASLLLLMLGLGYQHQVVVENRRVEAAKADAALMEQVDTEVSQSVPSTLEPLAQLMSVDADGADANSKTQKKAMNDGGDSE